MHYVCVENSRVISILNYKPTIPPSVNIVVISDKQHQSITRDGTHYFDTTSLSVQPINVDLRKDTAARNAQIAQNKEMRQFLDATDWKVLRHLREKTLKQTPPSLSDEEFLQLEQQRAAAAAFISSAR
jgi:hypothetical protein